TEGLASRTDHTTMGVTWNASKSYSERGRETAGIVGIFDESHGEPGKRGAKLLAFMAGHHDDRAGLGCEHCFHTSADHRDAAEIGQKLVRSHAARSAGGQHDGGNLGRLLDWGGPA